MEFKNQIRRLAAHLKDQASQLRIAICLSSIIFLVMTACQTSKSGNHHDKYLQENRLEDVIALIQYLAMESGGTGYKNLKSISDKLGEKDWTSIAREHRELFRTLDKQQDTTLVLLARYSRPVKKDTTEALTFEETKAIMDVAIQIYNGQLLYQNNSLQEKSINRVFWAALGTLVVSAISIFNSFMKQKSDSEMALRMEAIKEKVDLLASRKDQTGAN